MCNSHERFDDALKDLELKRKLADYGIDEAIKTGQKTSAEGDEAKLKTEETYLTAKKILVEAYYKQLESQNQQSSANTEQQNKDAAKRLENIERDKQNALLDIQAEGSRNQARAGELSRDKIEKALKDDLTDAENTRQKALNGIQSKTKSGKLTPVAAQNAEAEAERQFLTTKRKLYEDYFNILARMSGLSADQLKAIEQEKNKTLLEMDSQMTQARQQEYEGQLGGIKKYMDNMDEYVQKGAELLKGLFAPDQQKLDLGPLLSELDQLQQKTNLTSSEQERMKTIVGQIGKVMPDAVSSTDAYGNAIAINTGRAREEVDAQKRRASVMKKIMIAEKAWALASVGISYGQALMAAIKSAIGIPFPGNLVAVASAMAIPTLNLGLSISKIMGAKIDAPAFADGGFTGSGEGPGGYVDGPTLFTMGQRKFIAGEAGREFVVSNKALQNPVVADFARIMDVAQKTGNYSMISAANQQIVGGNQSAGTMNTPYNGITADMMMTLIQEQQLTRAHLSELAKRPISFDFLAHERKQAEIQGIRERYGL